MLFNQFPFLSASICRLKAFGRDRIFLHRSRPSPLSLQPTFLRFNYCIRFAIIMWSASNLFYCAQCLRYGGRPTLSNAHRAHESSVSSDNIRDELDEVCGDKDTDYNIQIAINSSANFWNMHCNSYLTM